MIHTDISVFAPLCLKVKYYGGLNLALFLIEKAVAV